MLLLIGWYCSLSSTAANPFPERCRVACSSGIQQTNDPVAQSAWQELTQQAQAFVSKANRIDRFHILFQSQFRYVTASKFRRHSATLVPLHSSYTSGNPSAINLVTGYGLLPCIRKTGTDISWLRRGYSNAKGLQFIGKGTGMDSIAALDAE